jgi:L-ribulokinase
VDAAKAMAHLKEEEFRPDLAAHAVYNEVYDEYRRLHDYFGRENDVMKRLKSIRAGVLSS